MSILDDMKKKSAEKEKVESPPVEKKKPEEKPEKKGPTYKEKQATINARPEDTELQKTAEVYRETCGDKAESIISVRDAACAQVHYLITLMEGIEKGDDPRVELKIVAAMQRDLGTIAHELHKFSRGDDSWVFKMRERARNIHSGRPHKR